MRADRSFSFGQDAATGLFWAYDEWHRRAYGIVAEGYEAKRAGGGRAIRIEYASKGGKPSVTLQPGESFTLRRRLVPAGNLLSVRGIAHRLAEKDAAPVNIHVTDPAGDVAGAKVTLSVGDREYGAGRTTAKGRLRFLAPPGSYKASIAGPGRGTVEVALEVAGGTNQFDIRLPACGYVTAKITGEDGQPIPCKVAFHGVEGTESPFFGPDTLAFAIHNLRYTADGAFRQEIAPGDYEVIISRGPEYDAVFQKITVERGRETLVTAKLKRVVDTKGWVSSDFHSHSSPSGDNTSSQLGRVLNLLCEHIEFAPCTEHNRIDSYAPHLARLKAAHHMATCTGMEFDRQPAAREPPERLSAGAQAAHAGWRRAADRRQPDRADRAAGDVGRRQ